MYRHFIFDIDGTLIDTEATGVLSLMDTIKELMGVSMPYEEAFGYFGIPSSKVAPMLGYEDCELFAERWEENFVRLSGLMKPFEGVDTMLAALKVKGVTVGCVTSRSRFEFDKDVHLKPLLPYFDHVVCAEDSQRHKPDPDPLLEYIRKASVSSEEPVRPEECLYLGDTMHDYLCSAGAGCDFAFADWKGRGPGNIPSKYVFACAQDVLDIPCL